MFFFFFRKKILSKERISAVNHFRKEAVKALKELRRKARDSASKEIYSRMISNVQHTPILFYPRRNMRETVFRAGNRVFGSVIKGEHVNVISIFQKGRQRFAIKTDYINLPAEHIFDGNQLTVAGIFTLAHEYAHFPKPALGRFARANKISYHQAEELMADTLSAKLAVALGYPKEVVMGHFAGRDLVYGKIPFRKFIWNAINN